MSGSDLLLVVDTSGGDAGVALAGEGFVDTRLLPTTERGQARTEDLAACTAALLAARGISPSRLALLGAVVGPGSYTGLRSGLAFVGGLAFAGSLPVVPVPSLELLAWRGAEPGETVAAWCPAGAGRALLAAYRRGEQSLDETAAPLAVEDGEAWSLPAEASALVCTAAVSEAAAAACRGAGVGVRVLRGDGLAALAALVRLKALRGLAGPASHALPLYVGQSTARPNRHRVAVADAPE